MEVMPERPERPTVISVLRSSTLLNALTPEDLDELASLSHLAYAERGETIWMKGSQVDFFGLVGNGFVKMVRSFATGQEVTSEIVGPGQIFGLLGVIEGGGCPLEARSVSNAWYLKIPKAEILHIHEERLVFKDQLLRRTVNLLPTVALTAQLGMGALLGLPGVLLALPLVVVMQVIMQTVVVQQIMDRWN